MKKSVLCLLVLIIAFAYGMGVACASENTNMLLSIDENTIEVENTSALSLNKEANTLKKSSSENEDNLKASNNPVLTANEGTFEDLQMLIYANYGGTLVLNQSYSYNDGFSTSGIEIEESIIIDGNNSVLDGKNQGRIFNIKASNVILKNIKFINGNSTSGGAVWWDGVNGFLSGCSFINNSADDGGAVWWDGVNGSLSGSNFTENRATAGGGAVYWFGVNGRLSGSNFTNNSADGFGGAIFSNSSFLTIDVVYFNDNAATKGSAVYKSGSSVLVITNTVFGRNRANSDKIFIEIGGNETDGVTVKIIFYGNDNIANAIWNDGTLNSIKLANITCEFSYNGTGREYKKFNKYNTPKEVTNTYYVNGSDELWQTTLENAQLIDINITDSNGNVLYSIVNGTETKTLGVERNILRAMPSDPKPLIVTDVDGKISVKFTNLKPDLYKISAKHQGDDYYTAAESNYLFYASLDINKTADVSDVVNNSLVNYTITVKNTGTFNATNVTIIDFLPQNLTYVDWGIIESNGASINNVSSNVWCVSKIATNSFVSIWITAKVNTDTAGTITNTVGVNCLEISTLITDKADITVVPVNLTIVKTSNPNNLTVFDNLTFSITVTNNANVNVTNVNIVDILNDAFKFDGQSTNYKCTFNNDKITWTIASLAKGESITIIFNVTTNNVGIFENIATVSCSENKTNKSSKTKVTINKAPSFVNATNVTVTYGDVIVINVTCSGATSVNYEVINVNNVVVAGGTLKSGESITGLNLTAGKYTVKLTTNVDGNHTSTTGTSTITVNKASSRVVAENVTVTYGEDIVIRVFSDNATDIIYEIFDENKFSVAKGSVKAGETIAGLNLDAGYYTVYLTAVVGENHASSSYTSFIMVNKAPSSVVVAVDISVSYGAVVVDIASSGAVCVNYKFVDEAGFVVAIGILEPDEAIPILLSASIDVLRSNSDNRYTLTLNLPVGKYTMYLTTFVDDNHISSNSSSIVTVNPAPSSVVAENITVIYGDEITVPVTSNNATEIIYKIIDENNFEVAKGILKPGEAITGLILAVGKYSINLTTVVDTNHTSATSTSTITVNKANSTVKGENITVYLGDEIIIPVLSVNASEIIYRVVDKDNIQVAGGVLKPGENIKLSGLPAGKYAVKLTTQVDENHISATGTSTITVEKIITHINIDAPKIKEGNNAVITVSLPDDATGTVKIEINGKSYTEPVKNGKAVFNIAGLKVGTYDIKAYYSGDDKYSANNASGSIEVLHSDEPKGGTEKSPAENKAGLAKYETGNPIVLLIVVLSLLCASIKRRK